MKVIVCRDSEGGMGIFKFTSIPKITKYGYWVSNKQSDNLGFLTEKTFKSLYGSLLGIRKAGHARVEITTELFKGN